MPATRPSPGGWRGQGRETQASRNSPVFRIRRVARPYAPARFPETSGGCHSVSHLGVLWFA